ncbi:MAG: hypothetical protein ACRERU_08100 [Methylococcales bacterium]
MKDTTPQAVQATHELLLWLIPQIDKFLRMRRFTLGERLESALLEVLELSVEAVSKTSFPGLLSDRRRREITVPDNVRTFQVHGADDHRDFLAFPNRCLLLCGNRR